MMRKPPQSATVETVIHRRLQYLYARRSVVEQLIRTLELYEAMEAEELEPPAELSVRAQGWVRELAS
jgi:hypothetical protein